MGVLFEYFAAPSDSHAVATIDRLGGPGRPSPAPEPPPAARRGLFRRAKPVAMPVPSEPSAEQPLYDTVDLKGVDPVVMIGTLESILTGVPYETVIAGSRAGNVLAEGDGGGRLVLSLSDEVHDALAAVDDERIRRAASEWLGTDEFKMGAGWSEADVVEAVRELSGLARRAQDRGDKLYCWVCV